MKMSTCQRRTADGEFALCLTHVPTFFNVAKYNHHWIIGAHKALDHCQLFHLAALCSFWDGLFKFFTYPVLFHFNCGNWPLSDVAGIEIIRVFLFKKISYYFVYAFGDYWYWGGGSRVAVIIDPSLSNDIIYSHWRIQRLTGIQTPFYL